MFKLSIITINLNNATGLKKTIESVLSQNSVEFEYVIIDGGSTDGSIEVIKQYEAKIHYWISESDKGIYQAMNKGILNARGDYCQFLNSGDYLVAPNSTERMLQDMPDCSILIGNMIKIQSNGKAVRDSEASGKITFLTFYRGTLNHSCAFIKRSLFNTYGLYDETLKIASDWKFYLLTVGIHNESIVYRNIDVSYFDMLGISNNHSQLLEEERRKVLKDLVPHSILADYDQYWFDIEQMQRLKRTNIIKQVLWLIERTLFKLEKWNIFTP